jgi:hypothetical protein
MQRVLAKACQLEMVLSRKISGYYTIGNICSEKGGDACNVVEHPKGVSCTAIHKGVCTSRRARVVET